MAGLLEGVLPFIYSQSDRLKRNIGGLLSDPMGTLQQTAGGLLDSHKAQQGLLGQAFANPARPFQVTDQSAMQAAAMNMLNGPLGIAPAGITAWHGSPHKFDKFDSSKIGAGEGAQAYGHGLYLAESPAVAKSYQESLTNLYGVPTTIDGAGKSVPIPLWLADKMKQGGNVDTAISEWTQRAAEQRAAMKTSQQPWIAERNALRFEDELKSLLAIKSAGGGAVQDAGSLYKVDLPDEHIAKMLDWDKPLSQQTDALSGVRAYAARPDVPFGFRDGIEAAIQRKIDGQDLYTEAMKIHQNPSAVAQAFREAGIPGIRYLDQGSRGTGAGTSNFVVFPGQEHILKILERNGVPLP